MDVYNLNMIIEFENNLFNKLDLNNISHIYDYCALSYYMTKIENLSMEEKTFYFNRSRNVLKYFLKNFPKYPHQPGAWYGMTGILYLMQSLSIEDELASKIKTLESFVYDLATTTLLNFVPNITTPTYSYDLINGITGVGIYFLEFYQDKYSAFLKKITKWLQELVDSYNTFFDNNIINIYDENKSKNSKVFLDLGVAHGILGPVYYLSKVYSKSSNKYNFDIVNKFIYCYSQLIRDDKDCVSKFPISIFKNQNNYSCSFSSRAGWCYGASGIYRILYLISKNLKNDIMEKIIVSDINTLITYKLSTFNLDCPTFCHGYSSLYYILSCFIKEDLISPTNPLVADLEKIIWSFYDKSLPYHFPKYDTDMNMKIVERNDSTSLIDGAVSIIITYISTKCFVDIDFYAKSLALKD